VFFRSLLALIGRLELLYWDEDGDEVVRIIPARRAAAKNREKEIRALKRMKDSEIDLSDIPEITDWSKALVGKFYRPVKQSLTIRLDADVLAWLRSQGDGYQTRINSILRGAMESRLRQ